MKSRRMEDGVTKWENRGEKDQEADMDGTERDRFITTRFSFSVRLNSSTKLCKAVGA